jgi:DNA-directed RNA polymerase subunit RPC12/RpoP
MSTLTVPVARTAAVAVGAGAAGGGATGAGMGPPSTRSETRGGGLVGTRTGAGAGKRYGFNCAYCSSRLEATESMAAQEGQCPTCGNNIVIPILDRFGRLIDPITKQIIKQDPHPVHAYAAAGERAPKILRQTGGSQQIQCPRCNSVSPITANNCKSCGMPFTMEGTTLEASGTSNGFCVASLVLGIIGIPAFCSAITPVLAIVFGVIGYNQVARTGVEGGGKGMAIAGIICGTIGLILFGFMILN